MKIQIVSDLHLEFNNMVIKNAGADTLCLAGDICLAEHLYDHMVPGSNKANGLLAARYRTFFDNVSKEFDRVLYIMGNHEHYSGLWNDTADHLREALDPWPNVTLMDNSWLNFGKTRIVGTTLWTDFNDGDPLTMLNIKSIMNDYHTVRIRRGSVYHKLRPIDTFEEHNRSKELIKIATETWDGDVVILGHHAPSRNSIHEKYRHDIISNGAFCSNLDDFIISQPKIKLWIHGHVHNPFDYQIGDCRVVCNPYGYPGEKTDFNPNFVVEV